MSQPQQSKTCPKCGRPHIESLWYKIFHNYKWTIGAGVVIAIVAILLWVVFNHDGFVRVMNTLATASATIAGIVVVSAIAIIWIRWALFPTKKKGGH